MRLTNHITRLLVLISACLMLVACGSSDDGESGGLTSSDPSKVYVSSQGAVTVSGVVLDALRRTGISGASVTIRVDGNTFTVTSASSNLSSPGSFAFLNVPASSEYLITVTSSDGSFAPFFYSNETPNISSTSGGIASQDIGAVEMYAASDSSITVKNINGGATVTGLTLFYDTQEIAQKNSGESVSVDIADVVATEGTMEVDQDQDQDGVNEIVPNGIYTFSLPNNSESFDIKIKSLIDGDGTEYELYNSNLSNDTLTSLTAGMNRTVYLVDKAKRTFTIYIHLVDEDGQSFDAGDVIVLTDNSSNDTVYAERRGNGTTNEYTLVTDANSFDFTLQNMDLDGDGVNDTGAVQLTQLDESLNVLDAGSFNSNNEATVVVPISMITNNQNISAELLSGPDHFQVNGLADVVFAFDRPVEIVHEVLMYNDSISEANPTVTESLVATANVFEDDGSTGTTTIAGQSTVSQNGGNLAQYLFDDDSSTQRTLTIPNAIAAGTVTLSRQTTFTAAQSVTVVPAANYTFTADNTLLTISLTPSSLQAEHIYTFEFAVKGLLPDSPVAYVSKTIQAKSDAAITGLTDLFVDNFDFRDTTTKNLANSFEGSYFTNQEPHGEAQLIDDADANNTATYDNSNIARIKYFVPPAGNYDPYVPSGSAIVLVSPAKLSGTVRVISQTETYLDATPAVATETLTPTGKLYGLDYFSNSGVDAEDIDLQNLTQVTSKAKYLLDVPQNHNITETGLSSVLGHLLDGTGPSSLATSGANISTSGIYYLYEIPMTAINGGYISSVTLDLDVVVNGVTHKGSQVYTVQ